MGNVRPSARPTEKPRRPTLRYHGGKWVHGFWIIPHFPVHRIYTESYGGAASILLQKERCYSEIYNDTDDEVVNVMRVLRDPTTSRRLERLLRLTPFSRTEFFNAHRRARNPVERARRTIVKSHMGFGSASINEAHSTGFRANANRAGTTPAHDWMHYPDLIPQFTRRLAGVLIECRPAIEVIQVNDTPETLHYCDPTYLLSTRYRKEKTKCYKNEMTVEQHRELAEVLHNIKGMAIISGYPSKLYDKELYSDWQRVTHKCNVSGDSKRTEVIWLNHAASSHHKQGNLFLLETE